jgi:hypothetical protein
LQKYRIIQAYRKISENMAVYVAFTDAWQQDMIGGYGI